MKKVQDKKEKKKNTIEEMFKKPAVMYTCPVCGKFSTSSNAKLNGHIDECIR